MVNGITNDDGIPTAVDLNYFRGTVDDLYAFAGIPKPASADAPVPAPVPNPPPVTSPVTPPIVSPQPVPAAPTGPITYVIAPGDNLYSIASRFHTTLDAIVRLNNITNPDLIYPGQVLVIPQ